MADNTTLNTGTGGDTIRDVAKTVNSPAKTQMVVPDIGGGTAASPEIPWQTVQGDAQAASAGIPPVAPMLWNGAALDRLRSATAAQGTAGTGVEATASFGVYNSAGVTLTSGQYSALQLDSAGRVALGNSPAIIGYAGSLNFQTTPVVPNLSASYSSGALVGTAGTAGSGSAILTVPVFRTTTQPSATLSQILFGWTGSETVNLTAYIFNKAPTTTGLTDTATPTFLAADLQHLVCAPITTTLAAPAAGSTKNFAATSLSLSVQNRDTTATANLYVVLVADAAISSAGTNDLFFSISGVQD